MWIESHAYYKPNTIDRMGRYVIVRKDFKENPDGSYTYMENQILKSDWKIFKMALESESAINDISDALVELAGILTGGD